jgi:choline kinase
MNFYKAYILGFSGTQPSEEQLRLLDFQVRAWSPASHAMWGIWGIVQAREQLESGEEAEFDYLSYSKDRLAAFSDGVESLTKGL